MERNPQRSTQEHKTNKGIVAREVNITQKTSNKLVSVVGRIWCKIVP